MFAEIAVAGVLASNVALPQSLMASALLKPVNPVSACRAPL